MGSGQTSYEFELTGGALCLDFTNTLGDRPRSTEEHLGDYGDLLSFSRQAGSVPAERLDELQRLAEEHPRKASQAFKRAIELRESLFEVFSRFVTGEMPEAKEIQSLNAVLQESLGRLQLRVQGTTLDWVWDDSTLSLERPTWPIVRSAAELLTSGEVSCVRECASETCSWLFIDRSRTKRRRWCDMSTCGNRAKARRHYQRQKKTRVSGWTSPREGRSDSGQ
jgi:predicted RNA-binding Zn ribbon-like protein